MKSIFRLIGSSHISSDGCRLIIARRIASKADGTIEVEHRDFYVAWDGVRWRRAWWYENGA